MARGAPEWRRGIGQQRCQIAHWQLQGALRNHVLAVASDAPEWRNCGCQVRSGILCICGDKQLSRITLWLWQVACPNGTMPQAGTLPNSALAVTKGAPDCALAVANDATELLLVGGKLSC